MTDDRDHADDRPSGSFEPGSFWSDDIPADRDETLRRVVAIVLALSLAVPTLWAAVRAVNVQRSHTAAVAELASDPSLEPLLDATWQVIVLTCDAQQITGSGFFSSVNGRGAVVTNRHVVDDAAAVTVVDLRTSRNVAVVGLALSSSADVAAIYVDAEDRAPLRIASGDQAVGTDVVSVGFGDGRAQVQRGRVIDATATSMVLSLTSEGGASGSPVLDDRNRVVGQIRAHDEDDRAIAIPGGLVRQALNDLDPAPSCTDQRDS